VAAGYTSPTARRRRLGVELRLLREKAGLTGEEAAARMSWSGSKLSRIERGQVSSNSDDIRDLLELYGVTDPSIRQALILLARESRRRGWWHVYGDVIPERFDVYLGLEPEACTLRFYHGQLVPGLLQTREYALSLLETHPVPVEPHEISRRLELRMRRQQILAREDPPHVWAVLDEAVVHRVIGGPAVMADQLRHLIRMSELPHITVQVLPFGRGAHPGLDGAFNILEFSEPEVYAPRLVHTENLTGSLYIEKAKEVRVYSTAFEHLRAAALHPNETRALLAEQEERMRSLAESAPED